jgi:hypothetical protein
MTKVLLGVGTLYLLLGGLLIQGHHVQRLQSDALRAQEHAIDVLTEQLAAQDTLLNAAMGTVRLQNQRLRTLEATCQQERPL